MSVMLLMFFSNDLWPQAFTFINELEVGPGFITVMKMFVELMLKMKFSGQICFLPFNSEKLGVFESVLKN